MNSDKDVYIEIDVIKLMITTAAALSFCMTVILFITGLILLCVLSLLITLPLCMLFLAYVMEA